MTIPSGFIPRIEAQEKYERSKSSFIRDVDQARERGDKQFLKNFIVVLKDDTVIQGQEATKKVLKSNDHLKPEWYIKQKFLDTRYWSRGKKQKSKAGQQSEPEPRTKDSAEKESPNSYLTLLERTNEDLRNQNARQLELIGELTENQKQSNVLVKSLTDILSEQGGLTIGTVPGLPKVQIQDSKQEGTTQEPIDVASSDIDPANTATKKTATAAKKSIWKKDLFWFINKRL